MSGTDLVQMEEVPVLSQVGGKAMGLYRLRSLGLEVPPFVVLTSEVYRSTCPGGTVPSNLPAAVEATLDSVWDLLHGGDVPLAVRSSAVDEDGVSRSFAGQMETVLNVRDRQAFSRSVLHCWASLQGERARAYRAARGSSSDGPAMAVVVQAMVAPESAGVLFTANPSSGKAEEVLVGSVWGLGEGLVSGSLDSDTYVLDRRGDLLSQKLAEKQERVEADPQGGTRRVPVPPDQVGLSSLDPGVLRELVRASLEAEAKEGHPLDIEFAVARGRIFFLQARPLTGFVPSALPEGGERQVWDNSNIVESYAGVTTPLTFSFIRMAYHAVYCQFCQVLGLSEEEIRRQDPVLRNMLGLIQGRVYYNLLNWYRLISFLPGYRYNKGFMEAMMGLHEKDDLELAPLSMRERYLVELPRLVRTGARAIWLQMTLEGRIRRFHEDFHAVHADLDRIDFDALSPQACMEHFRKMEEEILWKWKAPIINDFSAMIFYGLLKRFTVAWGVDPDGSLQNALICGQGDIESTQVTEGLFEVARLIAAEPTFKDAFISASPGEALSLLRDQPSIDAAFRNYLDRYGARCIEEMKLESIPMKDDPTFCIAMMRNYLKHPIPEAGRPRLREERMREEANTELARRLTGPRLWIYLWVLERARRAIRNRENQRLARTRAYALVRRIFRSVGASFHRMGFLDASEDIFYLELEEIRSHVQGAGTSTDLRALARTRRDKFDAFRRAPTPPDHLVTHGPICDGSRYEAETPAISTEGTLSGLGACPGIVERPACVLHHPDHTVRLDGEILVAPQTDPGWVVLFPSISGLVVEKGSMLSHSAIVAREMGIPAVVGVRGATKRIRTGNRIRMDGSKGSVEILDSSP